MKADAHVLHEYRPGELDLPLLGSILDPEAIEGRMRRVLSAGGRPRPVAVKSADLVAGRPGRRALVRYEMETAHGDVVRLYGKHFAEPARARRLHGILLSLSLLSEQGALDFDVPRPAGYVPELSLVLFAPAEGRPLGIEMAGGDSSSLRRVARSLAQMHRAPIALDRTFDLHSEVSNVREWGEIIVAASPATAGRVGTLVRFVCDRAAQLRLETDAVIHKDLHHGHVLVAQKPMLLDVDEMRFGDPAFDLAHFCTYLQLLRVRHLMTPLKAKLLEWSFLEGYAASTGWRRDRRFGYFGVYTCLKIAKQLVTGTGPPPVPEGRERRRQVRAMLQHGAMLVSGSPEGAG